MLITAASTLDRLASLTAPGAPVAPVIVALGEVAANVATARGSLEQARVGAALLGEVDRVHAMATQLAGALGELVTRDGMASFDPAFATDDASWDATFAEHAAILRRAQGALDVRAGQGATPTISSTTSV